MPKTNFEYRITKKESKKVIDDFHRKIDEMKKGCIIVLSGSANDIEWIELNG